MKINIVAFLLLGSWSLSASTIYLSGFEPPTYVVGPLSTGIVGQGQDGWDSQNIFLVENSFVHSGTQALSLSAAGSIGYTATHPLSYSSVGNPENIVTLQVAFTNSEPGSSWSVLQFNGTAGSLGQIGVMADQTVFLANPFGGFASGGAIVAGTWSTLTVTIDYTARTIAGQLNGTTIGSIPIVPPVTDLTNVAFSFGGGGSTVRTGYIDDLSITSSSSAVPEPSAVSLIVLGLCAVGVRRAGKGW